nr:DNA topoisomerase 1 [Megavirus caiporensis]
MSILVIVESPNKIKKISSFLGKNYIVKASVGHFRDLDPKKMSIDFENKFEPIYVILKPDVVKNLKSGMKNISKVYLAADPDREGEAIAQSIYDTLKPKNYYRLKFNAITRDAVLLAIKNAGKIEKNLVDAQKARRVLDRLFGYLISPILQRQIGGKLSAGRVQSVTVRIAIDKENEIKKFLEKNSNSSSFKVSGRISDLKSILYESTDKNPFTIETAYHGKTAQIALMDSKKPHNLVIKFLNKCLKSEFRVHSIDKKMSTRSPSPPFTTSTLQQEANRKFGMSIDATMKTAQKLYEGGFITYIRTDSVEISEEGHKNIKKIIEQEYGKEYYQKNVYKNKSASSQDAHEAIRPTHPDLIDLENEVQDTYQIKLYRLIWQRTIASQMKPAKIKIMTIQITISKYLEEKINPYYYFQSQIETTIFPGFMRVYIESVDDAIDNDNNIDYKGEVPKIDSKVYMEQIIAKQEYMRPPPRYSEASLVKKLENLGIGRPSTYVNTIKTILAREYIKIGDVPGIKREITTYSIESENKKHIMEIFQDTDTVLLGKESKKIIPTSLGVTVNDFLLANFPEMMDYKFTADMETKLDYIAAGTKIWHKVVQSFYDKLIPIINELSKKNNMPQQSCDKLLGLDSNGNEIFATKTKYGPVVKRKSGDKFVYSKIPESLDLETIKLSDAIKLLVYPKILGKYKSHDVVLQRGSYGFYIQYNGTNYSNDQGENISLDKAIELIKTKQSNNITEFNIKQGKKVIKIVVLKGPYGYYVQAQNGKTKKNYPIPKNIDVEKITEKEINEIISQKNTKKVAGSKSNYKKNGGSKKNIKANSKKT